ncbi:MAG: RHS repeat-associated core domain-containing protein, partial [Terriglobales bacterium]
MLRRIQLLCTVMFIVAGSLSLIAQITPVGVTTSNTVGVQPYVTYGGAHENVNLSTGDLNLRIPLVHLAGRDGHDVDLGMIYDSRIYALTGYWNPNFGGQFVYQWMGPAGGAPGWRLDLPTLSNTWSEYSGAPLYGVWCYMDYVLGLGASGHSFYIPTFNGSIRMHGNRTGCTRYLKPGQLDAQPYSQDNLNVTDAIDASFTRLDTTNTADIVAYTKDGLRLHFSSNAVGSLLDKIEDVNGNIITINNSDSVPTSITDTLGRVITINYSNSFLSGVSYKDSNGNTQTVSINYSSAPVTSSLTNPVSSGTQSMNSDISSIVLPNNRSFTFQYNSFGELSEVTYPTGGYTRYDYATFQNYWYVIPDTYLQDIAEDFREVTARHECRDPGGACTPSTEDTTTYSPTINGSVTNNESTAVVDALGNLTTYTFTYAQPPISQYISAPRELSRSIYQGNSTLLRTIQTDYIAAGDAAVPIRKTTTLFDVTPNLVTKTEWDYDTYNSLGTNTTIDNVIAQREYDYGSGGVGSLIRTTTNTWLKTNPVNNQDYTATGLHILNRKASAVITNSGGSTVAQTQYEYDNFTQGISASGAVQHDSAMSTSYTTRGNVTATSRWRKTDGAWLVTRNQYDDAGNALSTTDAASHTTSFSYADSWGNGACTPSGGNAAAYRTSTTNALNQTSHATYNSCSGTLASTTDLNGQVSNVYWDSMGRAIELDYPPDPSGQRGQILRTFNETSTPLNVITTTKVSSSLYLGNYLEVDGLGRSRKTELLSDPEGTDYTRTAYDSLGRKYQVWNPTRCDPDANPSSCSGESTYGITTYYYDALGRPKSVIQADGSVLTTSYLGNCTTVTDEAGKSRKSCSDAAGRMTVVYEDPNGLHYETDYQYDALNNLLTVTQQGGSSAGNWRLRSFTYDSLSQLKCAANPEVTSGLSTVQPATCPPTDTGTYTNGTIGYTYDNDGNVLTKTAPAPNQTGTATVTTSYSYDNLNRLTQKSYSGGPATPTAQYAYDGNVLSGCSTTPPTLSPADQNPKSTRTAMCDGSGATSWAHDSMGRVITEGRIINGVSGTTKYSYYLDGGLNVLIYPSGSSIAYTVNSLGSNTAARMLQALDVGNNINYVTTASYAPPGELQASTNGGSVYARATYNSRLQPLELFYTTGTVPPFSNLQQTTCPATVGTILHRTYNFGAGSNDNGDVLSEANCRDSNRTQNFVYDSLDRIQQAYTSGTNWGDTYTIDAWGNLTNIGPVSGKTTSENLNAAPASVKNQLSGYCHDSAGNLVLNGTCPTGTFTPTYSYDAENRLASTAGWTYVYDGDGERVMKCTGNPCVGTLYWTGTGSGPLAESSGSTFTEEYAFFNGKRVARRDLPGGAVHYYFSDHLGSASVVTDTSGSVQKESDYYPFGGEMVVSGSDINNYKFTGKERDAESGLDDFGARYYGSSTGRFMSPDWAERATAVPYATLASPQSLNLFSYVSDNPLGRTDPDGHRCAPGGSICDNAKGLSSDAQAAENQYLAMVAQSTQEAQNQSQTKQLTADDVSKGIKAFDSDKGDKNPGRVVKALDTMG